MTPASKKLLADVVERTGWTFAQAFLGAISAAQFVDLDVDAAKLALVAGCSAAFAVIKGFLASQIGKTGTASTLPEPVDPTPVAPQLPVNGPDPAP